MLKTKKSNNRFKIKLIPFIFHNLICSKIEPKWPNGTVLCSPDRASWVGAPNLNQCLWTCLQVHGTKRLSCHADLYTVSRCRTRAESEDHTSEKACKGSTLALKSRADVTINPKQGYQWPDEKNLCNKNTQNVHRKYIWPILMTFMCDVNICESHHVNLLFFVNLTLFTDEVNIEEKQVLPRLILGSLFTDIDRKQIQIQPVFHQPFLKGIQTVPESQFQTWPIWALGYILWSQGVLPYME